VKNWSFECRKNGMKITTRIDAKFRSKDGVLYIFQIFLIRKNIVFTFKIKQISQRNAIKNGQ